MIDFNAIAELLQEFVNKLYQMLERSHYLPLERLSEVGLLSYKVSSGI